MSIAAIIVLVCKVPTREILAASTFKSGMSASICVLGIAWLGATFVAAHEKEMLGKGAMAMPDTKERVTMKPGQSKSITIKFDKPGAFQIACHQPNHYQLGMRVPVVVS